MRFGLAVWVFVTAACLSACGDWKTDPASLTARTTTPAKGMACNACHAYPPLDSNHIYHLYLTAPEKTRNGPTTCLDCHRNSLQMQTVAIPDTFFHDVPDSISLSSINYPVLSPTDTADIRMRTWPIDSIIVRIQNHPLLQPGRPVPDSGLAEFMTGLAHMNGTVDVKFDAKYSDPARFGGDSATFDPKQETCSAVSCHPGNDPYRFAAPGKGLPGLKE